MKAAKARETYHSRAGCEPTASQQSQIDENDPRIAAQAIERSYVTLTPDRDFM
jgi:hypothetical protein